MTVKTTHRAVCVIAQIHSGFDYVSLGPGAALALLFLPIMRRSTSLSSSTSSSHTLSAGHLNFDQKLRVRFSMSILMVCIVCLS